MAGWDELFESLDSQTNWGRHQQDWGIDNTRYREIAEQRRDTERELRRTREDMMRRAEERARQIEQLERQRAQERGNIVHPDFLEALKLKSTVQKSEKELAIEKLAIKFCFVSNRLSVLKTLSAVGITKNPFEKKNETEFLKNIFDSVINEGARNGISRKEITDAIIKMSAEVSESDVSDMFIKHFLGAIAINIFKTNPDIIKNKKPVTKPNNNPQVTDYIPFGDDLTTERILRMIREMGVQRNVNDLFIQDYPDIIRYEAPSSSINTWLEHIKRWRD